jgi:hypothetical protein
MRAESPGGETSRRARRPTFATAGFDLNLESCKVTSMLQGSQEFALSLLEHDFDSSGLTVEVKSKVLQAGTPRSISIH